MINKIDDVVRKKLAEHLLPLADSLYADKELRDRKLAEEGWRRHMDDGITEESTWRREMAKEQKIYGLELIRQQLGMGQYHSKFLDEYWKLFYTRQLPSILSWDEFKASNPGFEMAMQKKSNERLNILFQEEVQRFGQKLKRIDFKNGPEYELFLKEQIAEALPGFSFDKSMCVSRTIAMTKACHLPWKWLLQIDKGGSGNGFMYRDFVRTNGEGKRVEVKDFENGSFGVGVCICHSKNKRGTNPDQLIALPPIYPPDSSIRYASQIEMRVQLKYNLRCYAEQLAWFDGPIRRAFAELEASGYSN